jgi:hypothetical protein
MQQALIYANYAMVWLDVFKQAAIRVTHFVRYEILSTPVYVFLKGTHIPVKSSDLLPCPPTSVDWYYDSSDNYFYQPMSSVKRERPSVLSAELVGAQYQEELTPFFEGVHWSGDKEPSHLHYVSAWAIKKGKCVPFNGEYSLKLVTNGCEEITRVLERSKIDT